MSFTYETKIVSHSILHRTYQTYQITNTDAVLDQLIAKDKEDIHLKDERIPYWMDLWPSAIALSNFILNNAELFKGKNSIEIGAGLAMPSIVAAEYCKTVWITDYLEDALLFAQKNAALNAITNVIYHQLDWRNVDIHQKFDVVLASDIAYEKRFHKELPRAINMLMKDDGVCYLTEPGRVLAKNFLQEVLPVYFDCTLLYTDPIQMNGYSTNVKVIEMRKK